MLVRPWLGTWKMAVALGIDRRTQDMLSVAALAGYYVRGSVLSQPGRPTGLVTVTHPLASHSPFRTAQLSLQRVHGWGSQVLGVWRLPVWTGGPHETSCPPGTRFVSEASAL